jgi:tubulin-specific chaperone D
LKLALDDYTIDSRGDIGSLVRLAAIDAITTGWQSHVITADEGAMSSSPVASKGFSHNALHEIILPRMARLSVEKLDKVRYSAWKCLYLIWVATENSSILSK